MSTDANRSSEQPDSAIRADQNNQNHLFTIVGIGASAGGLEAFTQFLGALPIDTGMAFVLVQHLDPNHQSLLSEILARTTQMSVRAVEDGMDVEPNCVYVIPQNRKMLFARGVLKLSPRETTQGRHLPIDAFFRSLAKELGSKAIGVVLSGGDGDGARGLMAIKEVGGLTFAQDEQSSQVSSMPRSAVTTGHVDFVLPPSGIAEVLARLSRNPLLTLALTETAVASADDSEEQALPAIFALLHQATGVDFSLYKQAMFKRRIQRRMMMRQFTGLEEYFQYLKAHPAEVAALHQEALINVTSFFRDPDVFVALTARVFPQLVAGALPGKPIRIWVPGCATGEEAYSLAISLLEFMAERNIEIPIQVFATDLSEQALEQARRGFYRKQQLTEVSPQRLERFFVQVEGSYQISKLVRKLCVFARQDLGSDPPFSQMDLISCRNVLIYFAPALQKRVLTAFHFGLKPTGFLLLGSSESLGDASSFFTPVNRKHKIYTQKPMPTRQVLEFIARPSALSASEVKPQSGDASSAMEVRKEADRIAFEQYVPPGVIINSELEILDFRGQTGPYMEPTPGRPSLNLMKMVHSGLRLEVRNALREADAQNVLVSKEDIPLRENGQVRQVKLEVVPFMAPSAERYFLVQFIEAPTDLPSPSGVRRPRSSKPSSQQNKLSNLQQELTATRADSQTSSEEQEARNQDLQIANEEILSSNEELQSINEELQNAKEEIQATNEELNTINDQQQRRNLELDRTSNDLQNLLNSSNVSILMLDGSLCIRRFTRLAGTLLHLIDADVGRPLRDINHRLDVPDLEEQILEVIRTLSNRAQDVQSHDGHWYNLQIRPYQTMSNKTEGAVLVLVDIDSIKQSTEQLQAARNSAEMIVETVQEPLIALDGALQVLTANHAFYDMFKVTVEQTAHRSIFELGNSQWNTPELQLLLKEALVSNNDIKDLEVEHDFESIGQQTFLLNARRMPQLDGSQSVLLTMQNITVRKQVETNAYLAAKKEQDLSALKSLFISMISHEFRTPLSAIQLSTDILHQHIDSLSQEKSKKHFERINDSVKHLTALLDEVSELTRTESSSERLNLEFVNISNFCQGLVEELRLSLWREDRILFTDQSGRTDNWVDVKLLRQVLTNLLTNGLKYSEDWTAVRLNFERSESLLIFQVVDAGIGIPPESLEWIFEPFHRSRNVGNVPGLGLGLTIAKRCSKQMGGTIAVTSVLNHGTTFTVSIPVSIPAENHG